MTCIQVSQETHRWSGIPISLRIFQFVVIHKVKDFCIVNEAEIDIFLEFPCFSNIAKLSLLFFLWVRVTKSSPHSGWRRIKLCPWGVCIYIYCLETFCKEDLSLPRQIFVSSSMSLWTHRHLFHMLGYNLTARSLFRCSESSFQVSLVPLEGPWPSVHSALPGAALLRARLLFSLLCLLGHSVVSDSV